MTHDSYSYRGTLVRLGCVEYLCAVFTQTWISPQLQNKDMHTHSHTHSRLLKHFSTDKPGWWHRQSVLIQYRWTCSAQYPVLPWQQCKAFRQVRRVRRKSCDSAGGGLSSFWRWTLLLSFLFNQCYSVRPWCCMSWWRMKWKTFFCRGNSRIKVDVTDSYCFQKGVDARAGPADRSRGHWSSGCSGSAAGMV